MASSTPMTITLYAEDNEVKATYTRTFVPWRLLKMAVRLVKRLNLNDLSEEDIDLLSALVIDVFGNQFSVEDLDNGADVTDMVSVLTTIMNKASGLNPTKPAM